MAQHYYTSQRFHPRFTLVSAEKNEGCHLLEWVLYHRLIGFDHIVVVSNNCDDASPDLLNRMQDLGMVEHLNVQSIESAPPQRYAIGQVTKLASYQNSEWVAFIDTDEFINVHVGNRDIASLIAHCGDANTISIPWKIFGSGGLMTRKRRLTLEAFTTCQSDTGAEAITRPMFKTMYHPAAWNGIAIHRPKDPLQPETIKWVAANGRKLPKRFLKSDYKLPEWPAVYSAAQINHYALRSRYDYLAKILRGDGANLWQKYPLDYWQDKDLNADSDITIQWILPQLNEAIVEALKDEELSHWHEKCLRQQNKMVKKALNEKKIDPARHIPDWQVEQANA